MTVIIRCYTSHGLKRQIAAKFVLHGAMTIKALCSVPASEDFAVMNENKYQVEKNRIILSCPMYIYRGEREIVQAKEAYGWMEIVRLGKRETVCGKEPKEPLESTEEMRQREKGETGQKQGRNQ